MRPWLLLIALPIMLAWPVLFGMSQNPMNVTSGLLLSARAGWLPGLGFTDLNVGIMTQAIGHLAAEQWLSGQVPWWNPYTGIGMPLAGEMQASALFLPFVLLLHFHEGPLLIRIALQIVAGLSTYALLHDLRLGRGLPLLGGALYGMVGTFAVLQHGPMMPIAFLPLFLLGIERARRGGVAVLAAAVLFSITAGFPETAYLNGLLALAWAGWRVATDPAPWRLARRIALGGTLGLLMAAPALWSFAHFLLNGTSANHVISYLDTPAPAIPALVGLGWLYPYATGPLSLFVGADPTGKFGEVVSYQGGFVGVAVVALATLGVLGRERRGLRLVLGGFVVAALLHVLSVPGVAQALNLIPLLLPSIVPRYVIAAVAFACIVLAVLAIGDWRRGALSRWAHVAAACVVGLGTAAALWRGWPMLVRLGAAPGFWPWPVVSLAWGLGLVATLLLLMGRPATRGRVLAVAALLLLDGAMMTIIPYLSGLRDPVIDRAATDFLHDQVGPQRFFTVGPYRANYGAYFATGQLNHEVLPLPSNWVAHVTAALDPSAHPVMFRGEGPVADGTPPGAPSHAEELVRRMDAYLALGVTHIVTPHDAGPFDHHVATGAPGTGRAVALEPGQSIEGTVTVAAGALSGFGLAIGTYAGQSDGQLTLELCAATCRTGVVPMRTAPDNAFARIVLDPPLEQAGAALRWRAGYADGARPVAVWTGDTPMVRIDYAVAGPVPPRVYADNILDVYAVPGRPYFESSCRLVMHGLDTADTQCDAPGMLVRRALFFDGWQATVNGARVPIAPYGDVMQQVALPAGASTVRFRYAPPYAGLCWALSALGVIGAVVGGVGVGGRGRQSLQVTSGPGHEPDVTV